MRRRSALGGDGRAGLAEPVGATLRLPRLVAAVAEPIAEAGDRERLTEARNQERQIAGRAPGDDVCQDRQDRFLRYGAAPVARLCRHNALPSRLDVLATKHDDITAADAEIEEQGKRQARDRSTFLLSMSQLSNLPRRVDVVLWFGTLL